MRSLISSSAITAVIAALVILFTLMAGDAFILHMQEKVAVSGEVGPAADNAKVLLTTLHAGCVIGMIATITVASLIALCDIACGAVRKRLRRTAKVTQANPARAQELLWELAKSARVFATHTDTLREFNSLTPGAIDGLDAITANLSAKVAELRRVGPQE